MKKFRPILGISLLVQSVTFFILAVLNIEKKRNLAIALGIFSAIGGVSGSALLYSEYKKRKALNCEDEDFFDEFDEFIDDFDDIDVDEDDIVCAFENREV